MMKIEPRTEGASLLLNKLQRVREGDKLEKSDIEEIMAQADIKRWLDAYGSKACKIFREILETLHKEKKSNLGFWGEKIDYGLRKAVEEPDQMSENLKEIKKIDWDSVVQKALNYLPQNTELEPDFIVTIDGFNGGMFRVDTVFLSTVYFDRSQFKEDSFAHEFHHMGAEYWLKKNSLIKRYGWDEGPDLIQLFIYLVSEGLANALCSPGAITKTSEEDEGSKHYNQMIGDFEDKLDELYKQLENLVEKILEDTDEFTELYNDFTLDKEGAGLPPGHFLSGRMVLTMKKSRNIENKEIIGLVKYPFDFFKLYNKAAVEMDEREFSPELVDRLDTNIEDMEEKTT